MAAQVEVYNKRTLLSDELMGEAVGTLAALRRGAPVALRLTNRDSKLRGARGCSGEVSFTLDGCGAGGDSQGDQGACPRCPVVRSGEPVCISVPWRDQCTSSVIHACMWQW